MKGVVKFEWRRGYNQAITRAIADPARTIRIPVIEDNAPVSPSDAVINLNLKEQTAALLKTLTPREQKIIKMRFGLEDGSEHTLEEVGQTPAVTRERIRQIEAKALRKLRHPSRSRKLRGFLGCLLVEGL